MRKLIIIAVVIGVVIGMMMFFQKSPMLATEAFIQRWFTNDNGTLATYILDNEEADADYVQGREALSESVGLCMVYAVEKQDVELFEEAYQMFQVHFYREDGFIPWKLTEAGVAEVTTNALVDDLRILHALYQADELWNRDEYRETADQIGRFLAVHNMSGNLLTDFYDVKYQQAADVITLSYIDPHALREMFDRGILSEQAYSAMIQVLSEAEMQNGFLAKYYDNTNQVYIYEKEVHMVDQALAAYYRVVNGDDTGKFLRFVRDELMKNGEIAGVYDSATQEAVVKYESPAVYGILIWYCLELGEQELAEELYERMVEFRDLGVFGRYFGGYSVEDGNTHLFDNLVPLIGELRFKQ
ncbi:glycosyl hydrolase family 8 [Gracilibacillus caseinilyticus]|uniref:Glycosyl hydrolase family 8 n=1 Tax=Gracilibacillus caseinilyticus TaxID=2932256 RepID=A0ABY4EV48_9BACI|nr:glycosyl hydrolase family 8 [Gracilibacillus caseinilyticus]UOQ48292.1 glycosyl hydrolase family 8 [Gracilibacillus caseinilyticus]